MGAPPNWIMSLFKILFVTTIDEQLKGLYAANA